MRLLSIGLRALVLVILLASPSAMAQTPLERFDVGETGRCPSVEDIERALGRGKAPLGSGWTFVLRDSARLFQSREPAAASLGLQPGLFKKVVLYRQSDSRVLVGWDDRGRCGWIDVGDILVPGDAVSTKQVETYQPQPLLVRNIDPNDKSNQITAKAVLNNLNQKGDVVLSYSESDGKTKYADLKQFDIYSIFARAAGGRELSGFNSYLLLGYYYGKDGPDPRLVGWVNEKDVYYWNSRMAAFWGGNGVAHVWHEWEPGRGMLGKSFLQEADQPAPPADRNVSRWPILAMSPNSHVVQERASRIPESELTPLRLSSLVDAYRVAIPFAGCRPGSTDCLTQADIDKAAAEYHRRLENMGKTDILFLIDGTESMDPYFNSTAEGIEAFVREFLAPEGNTGGVSLRVGAAVYGDYLRKPAEKGNVYFRSLVEMHDPRSQGSSNEMAALHKFKLNFQDPNHDYLEAPFAGIIRAAEDTSWRSDAGFRVIVHVHDHGNREYQQSSHQGKSDLQEELNEDDVVAALQAKADPNAGKAPIQYVPISVVGGRHEIDPADKSAQYAMAARNAALKQDAEIVAKLGLSVNGPNPVLRSYNDLAHLDETPEARKQAVKDALKRALEVYRSAIKTIETRQYCAANPQQQQCVELERLSGAFSGPVARAGRQLSEENGFTEAEIENIYSRQQTVAYAWVNPVEAGQQTLTYWVALDQPTLHQDIDAMAAICSAFAADSGSLETGLRKILRQMATEMAKMDDLSDRDTLATLLSLPFWERQTILGLDWRVIAYTIQNRDQEKLTRWRRAFCMSARLLSEVERARRPADISKLRFTSQYTLDASGYSSNPTQFWQPYVWAVTSIGGEKLFYVPYEYFPNEYISDQKFN